MKLWLAVTLSTLMLVAQSGFAAGIITPGVYQLQDHGFGGLGPDYGLRDDSIGKTFSVDLGGASVTLNWGGGTTATITGVLYDNATTDLWTVNYLLTGITPVGTMGFIATGGTGTLTDPLLVNFNMLGEQDISGSAFTFLADGHRIPGDDSTPVGRGWVLPPNSTDDWLVRAIPEPGTWVLLSTGGLLLARRRR